MRQLKVLGLASLFLATIIACAGTGNGDTAGSSTSSSSSSSSGSLGGGDSGAGVADQFKGCATDSQKATTLPLDLYVMFDTSGSMATLVADNKTKYAAATDALVQFANDPGSAGIGMGLQFFPLPPKGVPASCNSTADCGAGGACSTKACTGGTIVKYCTGDGDCGADGPCVAAEVCSIETNTYCSGDGQACPADVSGFDQGTCQGVTKGYCTGGDSCAAADYANPAVPIAALPGNVDAIKGAIAAKSVQSATPTSAALQGAVDGATAYAKANAGHAVVVVFLTDGLPQGCDQNIDNIATIAGTAAAATPSIKTFVIGVFGTADQADAQTNLDKIADKGSSSKAFLVGQSATTEADFLKAMNTVRGSALPCDYDIPQPTSGTPDYSQLNIQRTDPSGNKTVFAYTKSQDACTNGGWYYDTDPSTGGKPTKIILCPSTCTDVKNGGGQVDVVIGCTTVVK